MIDFDASKDYLNRVVDLILTIRGLSHNSKKRSMQLNHIYVDKEGNKYYGYGIKVKEPFKIEIEKQELFYSAEDVHIDYSLIDPQADLSICYEGRLKELGLSVIGERK